MSTEKLRLKVKNLKREIAALHRKHKLRSQLLRKKDEEILALEEKIRRLEEK